MRLPGEAAIHLDRSRSRHRNCIFKRRPLIRMKREVSVMEHATGESEAYRREYAPDGLYVPGGWLAHYTSADIALSHILPSMRLRASKYERMRDPAENKDLHFGWHGALSEAVAATPAEAWAVASLSMDLVNDIRANTHIISFTRDCEESESPNPFSCCWSRPRMWEQYGGNHTGVCLVFARHALEERCRSARFTFGEVDYARDSLLTAPDALVLADPAMGSPDRWRAAVDAHISRHMRPLFFLKGDDYGSEYEFRIVMGTSTREFHYVPLGAELQAVVVGTLFPPEALPRLESLCHERALRLWRVEWVNSRPMLVAPRSEWFTEGRVFLDAVRSRVVPREPVSPSDSEG
jgi:hypothetical protein